MTRRQSQQSRAFNDLSSLLHNLLRSPPSPIELFPDDLCASPALSSPPPPPPQSRRMVATPPPITPFGFASLMLGISLALMFCGSVTVFIGFMSMPWVLGLVMVFYFVSSFSVLSRSTLCYASSAASAAAWSPVPPSPCKNIPSWRFT